MEQKYNARPIKVEDHDTLMKWWESYDGIEIPDSKGNTTRQWIKWFCYGKRR